MSKSVNATVSVVKNDVGLMMMESGARRSNKTMVKVKRKALHQQTELMGKACFWEVVRGVVSDVGDSCVPR